MQDLIQSYIDKNSPFYAFKLPNEKKVKIVLIENAESISFKDLEKVPENTTVVFPFDDNLHRGWAFSTIKYDELFIEEKHFNSNYKFDNSLESFSTSEFEDYKLQFSKMMHSFENDGVNKAILSKVIDVKREKTFSIVEAFSRLLSQYPSTYVFLISAKETGIWMGASPELLFSKQDNKCKTVSLAGTRSPNDSIDKWTDKEREEQGMVTSFIDKILEKYNVFDYNKENLQLVSVGSVSHLKTSYEFEINLKTSWGGLVEELHPTPALCGEPKVKAMNLIKRVEPHNRELYGGFIGFIDKDVNLYVNLRSMKIEKDKLNIFVGGGLTRKSKLEDEWDELKLKSQILLSIL